LLRHTLLELREHVGDFDRGAAELLRQGFFGELLCELERAIFLAAESGRGSRTRT
jgi:hypothetical protein